MIWFFLELTKSSLANCQAIQLQAIVLQSPEEQKWQLFILTTRAGLIGNMTKNKSQNGFIILDIVISMVIIVTVLTTVILVVFSNQTVALDTKLNSEALGKAEKIIEDAKIQSRLDYFKTDSSSLFDGFFQKNLLVHDISPCLKNAKSSVEWQTDPNRPGKVELETILINVFSTTSLSGDCGPTSLSKTNWENINCQEGYFDYPSPDIVSTGVDLIKRGQNNYAVLAAEGSAGSNNLWVIDINDVNSPFAVSSLDTGSSLNDVDVAGKYAFSIGNSSDSQLRIVDLTDLSNPILITSRSLPGTYGSEGRKIFYHNNLVYVGTDNTYDNEFYIYSVLNPANPTFLGGYQIDGSVEDLFIREDIVDGSLKTLAYMTLSAINSAYPEFIVLDVSDPGLIVFRGFFDMPGNKSAKTLYILGKYAYIGMGSGVGDNLYVLNISNLNKINLSDATTLDSQELGIQKIMASGNLAFASIPGNSGEVIIIDTTDKTSVAPTSSCYHNQNITDFDLDNKYIYTANYNERGLGIIADN